MTARAARAALLACLAGACATGPGAPPAAAPLRGLADGRTIEDLLFEHGTPSRVLEGGRIVTWRFGPAPGFRRGAESFSSGPGGHAGPRPAAREGPVAPRPHPDHEAYTSFDDVLTSLVVVLDASGRVVRSVSVPVHAPSADGPDEGTTPAAIPAER